MQSESGYHFISDYISCQQKFYWSYVEGLIPKQTSKHLLFGDSIHKALAEYYSTSGDRITRGNNAIGKFTTSMLMVQGEYVYQDDYLNDMNRGILLLNEYFIAYESDPLNYAKHDGVEVYREIRLPSGKVLTGNIDLISGNAPNRSIYDHKTTGWAISMALQPLRISNQATTYLALSPESSSMVYNIMHQKGNKCAFHREIVYRTSEEISDWLLQCDDVLGEISGKVGQPKQKWRKNDKACFAYNHICEYFDLCKGGNPRLSMGQFKYREKGVN